MASVAQDCGWLVHSVLTGQHVCKAFTNSSLSVCVCVSLHRNGYHISETQISIRMSLSLTPKKMGSTCYMVTHQVSWLCLIMRYMWLEDIMNRQEMTYLTIWLLTSESVQLSLLCLDCLYFALTSLRLKHFPLITI